MILPRLVVWVGKGSLLDENSHPRIWIQGSGAGRARKVWISLSGPPVRRESSRPEKLEAVEKVPQAERGGAARDNSWGEMEGRMQPEHGEERLAEWNLSRRMLG